jgi:type IV secretory pathway VirB10-like protein
MSDELQGGVNLPLWAKLVLSGVFIVAGSGVAYWVITKDSGKRTADDLIVQTNFAPDEFFQDFAETQAQAPEPFEDFAADPTPARQAMNKAPIRTAPVPAPAQKKEPTAEELAALYFKPQPSVDPRTANRDRLRRMRMEAGSSTQILFSSQGKKQYSEETPELNPDYGLNKDTASQPLNFSRIITADRLFPVLLRNDIRTDLGGQVTAQAEEDIYGFHGRNVLIPAGSQFIGSYEPLAKVGMERLPIIWTRCITPSGVNINLTNAESTDAMGRSGIGGDVDNRYFEKYGMAFLISTLSSIGTSTITVDSANQQIAINNFTNESANLANRILEDQIDIKPRMRIPAGTRMMINATRDIFIPIPESGHTTAKEITL